jgi:hypothetical protein
MDELPVATPVVDAVSVLSYLQAWLQGHGEDELAHRVACARDGLRALVLDAELAEDVD